MEHWQNIGALLGSGRSGSTWLGTILSSHPDVSYRFEPFTRLRTQSEAQRFTIERVLGRQDPPVSYDDIEALISIADPELVKPPFLPPSVPRSVAKWGVWSAAKTTGRGAKVLAKATGGVRPWLIFKDVDVEASIPALLKNDIPVLFLIRDPRAVVASRLKGQETGVMPAHRQKIVRDIAARRAPDLLLDLEDELEDMSPAAVEALLWRIDGDEALASLAGHDRAAVCHYDELIADPFAGAEMALAHFGLEMHADVERFIEATISGPSLRTRVEHGEIGIKPYFSVFRDPGESANKWRKQLSHTQITEIEHVLEGSRAWASGRSRNLWH